jgi:hypothetical protein
VTEKKFDTPQRLVASIDPSRFHYTNNLVTVIGSQDQNIELQPDLANLENLGICGANCHIALQEYLLIQVNNVLNKFLVGESLTDSGVANDPDEKIDISGWNLPKLRKMALHLNSHLNSTLSLFNITLDKSLQNGVVPKSRIAAEICDAINTLHTVRNNIKSTKKQYELEMNYLTNPKLNEISSLLTQDFSEFYSFIVLVGSYGSGEEISGASDVDLFGCIKSSVFSTSDKLIELRSLTPELIKLIQKFDKNQHHGIISVTEQILESYPNAFFPIETLGRGELIFSDIRTIEYSQIESNYSALHQVISVRQHFRSLFLNGFKVENEYLWKYSVGLYLLFPTLFLQCSGEFRFKGDTFEPYKKIVAEMESPIFEAERIRQDAYSLKGIYSACDKRRVLLYQILCEIEILTQRAIDAGVSEESSQIEDGTGELTPVLLAKEELVVPKLNSMSSDFFFFGRRDFSKVNSDIDWGLFYNNEDHADCSNKVREVHDVFNNYGLDTFEPVFHFNLSSKDQIGLIFPFLNFETKHNLERDPTNSFERSASSKRDMAMELILAYALKPLEDLALHPNSNQKLYSAAKSAYYLCLTLDILAPSDFISEVELNLSKGSTLDVKNLTSRILDMFTEVCKKLSENSVIVQSLNVKVLAIYADQYFMVSNWNSSLFWFYFNLSIAKTGRALYVLPDSFMGILHYFDSEFSDTTWSYEKLILRLDYETRRSWEVYDSQRAKAVKNYLIGAQSCMVEGLRTLPFMPADLQTNWSQTWKDKYLIDKTNAELHEVFEVALNEFDFADRSSKLRMLIDKEFDYADLQWVLGQLEIRGSAELKYLIAVYLQGVNEFNDYDIIFDLYSSSELAGFDPFWIDYNRHFLHIRLGNSEHAVESLNMALAHLFGRQDPFYLEKYQEVKERLSRLK